MATLVVGVLASYERRGAVVRSAVRWLLPAAGVAFATFGLLGTAHADVDTSGQIVAPTSVVTGTPITWSIPTIANTTTTCVITDPAGAPTTVDCSAGTAQASADLAGSYRLDAYDGSTVTGSPAATSTVTAVPPTPTLGTSEVGTKHGSGTAVSWQVTDADSGATLQCPVSGPGTLGQAQTCGSGTVGFDLTGQPFGTYTVDVTAVDNSQSSQGSLQLSYTYQPPAVTLASGTAAQSGTGRTPSWSVQEADTSAAIACTVQGPTGSGTTTASTCDATAVALALAGKPTGHYAVTVTATDQGVSSDPLALTYDLLAPDAPTLTGASAANQSGTGRSPGWSVQDSDTAATITCQVTGPATSSLTTTSACGSTVSLDLTNQPAGTYTVTVTAVDDTGTSAPLTLTYTLYPPAPTVGAGSTASQSGTGRAPSWSVDEADSNATLSCVVAGPANSTLSSAATCAGGTVALNLTNQPAGTYTVTVKAVDAGIASQSTLTLTYTLYPPDPTLASGTAAQSGNGRLPSWSVQDADPQAGYRCDVTGPANSSATASVCSGGTVKLNLSGQPLGTYTVHVTAVDNGVDSLGTLTLTYSLQAPPAPTLTSGAQTQSGTGRTPSWGVSDADAGATLQCVVSGPATSTLSTTTSCGSGTVSLDLANQPAGTYTVTVTAVDSGVSSASSLLLTYTLYPPDPTLASGSAAVSGYGRSPSWSVQDSDPQATYTCTVTGPTTSSATASVCSGGTVTLDLSGQPLGTYTVVVTAVDHTVNSLGTLTLTYTLLPPATPTLTSGTPTQSGTGRSPSWGVDEADPGATLQCAVSGPTGSTLTTTTSCGATVGLDLTNQPAGTYTVTVTALDAGVSSPSSLVLTYTLYPPAPTASGPTSGTDRSPSWALSTTDPTLSGYTCTVSGPGATASVDCSSATVLLDLTNQPAGTYTVTVTAVDHGVSSTTALTLTYLLTPPPPSANGLAPTTGETRSASWTVSDTDPTLTGYACTVSGPGAGAVVTCTPDGTVSLGLSGQPAGTYTVTVFAVDNGVRSVTGVTFTYLLTPPAPTGGPDPTTGTSRTPTWSVATADPTLTGYGCTVSGPGAGASVTCTAGGTVTLNLANQPAGTYTVIVTAVDHGVSSVTSLTLTYLLTPPAPTATTPDQTGTGRQPTWSISDSDAGVSSYTCTVSGPANSSASVDCSSPGSVSLSLTGQPLGTYTVTVTAFDHGVASATTLTLTYTLVPPPAPTSAPGSTTGTSRSPAWSLSDTDPNLTGYSCTVTGPGAGATVDCSTATMTLTLSGQPAGTYTITVYAVDQGVQSPTPLTLTYLLTPPPPTASGLAPTTGTGRTASWTVSDTDPTLTSYVCTVSGPGSGATVICGLDGTVTLDLSAQPAGTYTVTVYAEDNGVQSATAITFTYALTPPAPTGGPTPTTGTSRTPAWSVATADPTLTGYSCTVSGPGAGAVVSCTAGGSVTLNLANQPAGTYTVIVTAVDHGVSSNTSLTLTYLLTPPAPTTANATQVGTGRSPAWSISDSDPGISGYTCTLSGPSGASVSVSCGASGAISLDLTAQPAGTYRITVIAIDNAVPSTALVLSYTLIPPPPTLVSSPTNPDNNRHPAWTVTDAMPSVTYSCHVSGPSPAGASCANGTVVVDLSNAADGTYTVSVLAVDTAGHTSDAATPLVFTFTLDTTAPPAATVTASPSPAKIRSATFTVGNFQAPNTLVCTLTGPGGVDLPVNCGSVVTVDLTGQPDGTYTLQVGVRDLVGNVSTLVSATYVLDTTAPVAPTVTAAKTGNSRTPTLQVTTEPDATLTCTVQRFFVQVSTGPCPGGVVDLTGQPDGDFEITVFATDAAGNTSPGTTITYTLDTVAPATPTLTAPASPSPLTNPVWRWTSEPGTTATCTLTRTDGDVVAGPVPCTGGSYLADLASWPDDTYVFTVVLTDAAGNKSRVVTSTFVLDRTAPVPPTVVPPNSPSASTTPRWTITAPHGATLTCTLLRGATVVFGPAVCPGNGVFSLAGQPDGTYTLRVTATGANGLVSAVAVSSYVLDTHPPATPALTYDSGSAGGDRSPYWGFTLPGGTTGRCDLLHNGVVVASQSGCRGAVSFTIDGAPGTYTLRVIAIDAAGNASHALFVSYTLLGGGTGGAGGLYAGGVGGHNLRGTPSPTSAQVQQAVAEIARAAQAAAAPLRRASGQAAAALVPGLPLVHDQLTNDVSHAVQNVFNAVSKAGGGTGFPLLLIVLVGVFLLVQSRIDKRDPKLAFASVAADDNLQFRPPPSRARGSAGRLNPGGAT